MGKKKDIKNDSDQLQSKIMKKSRKEIMDSASSDSDFQKEGKKSTSSKKEMLKSNSKKVAKKKTIQNKSCSSDSDTNELNSKEKKSSDQKEEASGEDSGDGKQLIQGFEENHKEVTEKDNESSEHEENVNEVESSV